ncbi:MAG: OmpH family outer membrane protein [Thermoanaerobaculaceae bacterium]|nr:OmpH family outer membrane protein [Thermoanaerobaculaceae bacterium]TAM55454.1 MAG: OmpH family outer membrane protein [Acidobacteriota bacterium]
MRIYLAMAMAAVVAAAAGPVRAQEPPKQAIAVIDVNLLVQDSAAGKEAMVRLKKAQDEKVAERKKMTDEINGLQKQLESQRSTLTDSKIADLQKQIEDKSIALKRFDDDAQQQLEENKRKELDGLEKQIMPIIQELGKEKKLLLIFNKFQSGLVYADDSVDITDEVLKRFNTRVTK